MCTILYGTYDFEAHENLSHKPSVLFYGSTHTSTYAFIERFEQALNLENYETIPFSISLSVIIEVY